MRQTPHLGTAPDRDLAGRPEAGHGRPPNKHEVLIPQAANNWGLSFATCSVLIVLILLMIRGLEYLCGRQGGGGGHTGGLHLQARPRQQGINARLPGVRLGVRAAGNGGLYGGMVRMDGGRC
jgi:hypothetical protein